jgi:hypothetical protein
MKTPLQPCESKRATKSEPDAWGDNWTTQSLRDINAGNWSSVLGVGREADGIPL